MNILHARRTNRLLLTKDVFHDTHGALCKVCKDFIGKDALTVRQHSNRSHPHSNVEGSILQYVNVDISVRWLSPEFDQDEIDTAHAELEKEISLRIEGKILQDNERSLPIAPRSDDSVDLEARENRRRNEDLIRSNRQTGLIRPNERRPINHFHSSSSSDDDPSTVDNVLSDQTSSNPNVTVDSYLSKAQEWKEKCMKENDCVLLSLYLYYISFLYFYVL